MPLTKVTSAINMKTRTPLDARSFEQLLAAAYLAQQRLGPVPFPPSATSTWPARDEAERLAAIAEAQTIVHGNKLRLQETLQLVTERALRITGGAGAAIWLVRGPNAICQTADGISKVSLGQSLAVAGSRLMPCLRDGAIFRCADVQIDPRTRYDALPGVARGSIVAVPIHYEGQAQGALEVTFAEARGFEEADVRTCQILSGLVSETVALAAGQEQRNILESERATLLEALDRLQPHLSKLLNGADLDIPETKELAASATGDSSLPAGPTPSRARFGKYLMAQQEQAMDASARQDWSSEQTSKVVPRNVQTALNLSVGPNRTAPQHDSWIGDDDAQAHPAVNEHGGEMVATPAHLYDFDDPPFSVQPVEHYEAEPRALAVPAEPWLEAEVVSPATQEAPKESTATFWQAHWADVCLAVSVLTLIASIAWPRPQRAVPAPADPGAVQTAPKLSAFEELLVSMGLAEAPPPPMTYTGTPGVKVWVDLHNALYYCPGAEPYGTTPKGKFMTQHDAQYEQFQPARGQPCD